VWVLSRGFRLLELKTISRVLEEDRENPFVEMREEKRNKRAMAAMASVSKRITDLGFGLAFVGLWNAIAVAETKKEDERVFSLTFFFFFFFFFSHHPDLARSAHGGPLANIL
jgi:hypothetical protein